MTCRVIECPVGQYRHKGECVPVFKTIYNLNYRVVFKMFIRPREREIEWVDPNTASAKLIPEFELKMKTVLETEYEIGICSVDLWMKEGSEYRSPFVVFLLDIHGDKQPVSYANAMQLFRRVYDESTDGSLSFMKLYFADHIVSTGSGYSEFSDAHDDKDLLYMKSILTQFGDYCGSTLTITESRFCPRVKLTVDEYVNHTSKLYLKHAKMFVYGNEYTADSATNGSVYVCIHRYIDLTKQRTNNRGPVRTDQDANPLISKDFGFFIGCLALITVFVLVFLAKIKYAGTPTTNTATTDMTTTTNSDT